MTYAIQQNLIDRFGNTEILQLTDRDGDAAIDAAVIDGALEDADALINSYLESRYSLPLTSTPRLLRNLASDIARYQLYDDRAPESVKNRYDAAIATLKDIASGKAQLGLDASNADTDPAAVVKTDGPDRVFTDDAMKNF